MTLPPVPPRDDADDPRPDRTTQRLTSIYRVLFVVFTIVVVLYYASRCAGVALDPPAPSPTGTQEAAAQPTAPPASVPSA